MPFYWPSCSFTVVSSGRFPFFFFHSMLGSGLPIYFNALPSGLGQVRFVKLVRLLVWRPSAQQKLRYSNPKSCLLSVQRLFFIRSRSCIANQDIYIYIYAQLNDDFKIYSCSKHRLKLIFLQCRSPQRRIYYHYLRGQLSSVMLPK